MVFIKQPRGHNAYLVKIVQEFMHSFNTIYWIEIRSFVEWMGVEIY